MSFTFDAQDRLADLFIRTVEEKFHDVGALLRRKHALVKSVPLSAPGNQDLLDTELRKMYSSLSTETKFLLAEMDAKLVDVMWRARKFAGIVVVNGVDDSVQTGDRFSEVVGRFCRLNLHPTVVQQFIPYAFVWPSLTTHPTNPTSVQYTRAGLEIDRLAARPHTSSETLLAALKVLRDTSMEFDPKPADLSVQLMRKNPDLETEELTLILNVIYDSVFKPWNRLRNALDRYGYKTVKMPKSMIDVNVWGAGDGDGNPNVTSHILEQMVFKFRNAIKAKYATDLTLLLQEISLLNPARDDGQDNDTFHSRKESVVSRVREFADNVARSGSGGFSSYGEIIAAVESLNTFFLASGIVTQHHIWANPVAELFREIVVKVNTFGLRFTGIDVRHNSVDIMECYCALHSCITKQPPGAFLALPEEEQMTALKGNLSNAQFLTAAAALPESVAELERVLGSAAPARVFSRLRVVAKYPGMFRKLIIAETRSSANAIAAMLLLRMSGNVVGEKGACVSIVPLFESREDLIAAPYTVHLLATDPTFLKHLEVIGHFLVMIAKSDTTRLAGPGVTGCQETTISQLLSMNTRSYGNRFKVHVFIGGGDDQMRGGGRIVETPHTVMLGANRLGSTQPSRVAMTIQGLQMQLVFGSTLLSSHFIEAFAAQQMLAVARVLGHHPYRAVPAYCNRLAADHDTRSFFHHCMNMYEIIAGKPKGTKEQMRRRATIVEYFSHFPASVIASTNKSSRPLARKSNADPLEGRAISLDQLSKHDGAYLTSTLGVAKALHAMNASMRHGGPEPQPDATTPLPMSPVRHAFLANKTFRDFVRMQAVVLWQKDFTVAWALRGGKPSTPEERQKLVDEYMALQKPGSSAGPATARQFLARIELNDAIEAALLVEALTGVYPTTVTLRDPLNIGWKSIADAMHYRRNQSALSQIIETDACLQIKALSSGGSEKLLAEQQLLAYYGYVGANAKFSTPSFSLSMTDPQKEGNVLLAEQPSLPRPSWMFASQRKAAKL